MGLFKYTTTTNSSTSNKEGNKNFYTQQSPKLLGVDYWFKKILPYMSNESLTLFA